MDAVRQVLVPALVAAAVALSIEFFAKPRLEARKEAMLDVYRARRALRRALAQWSYLVGRLDAFRDDSIMFDTRAADLHDDLSAATAALQEQWHNPDARLPDYVDTVAMRLALMAQQLELVLEHRDQVLPVMLMDAADDADTELDAFLGTRWWGRRLLARIRIRRMERAGLPTLNPPSDPSP